MYFQDEMRYGTRTATKRRWTRQGRRPTCAVKVGYEWGYLYVALSPYQGDVFALYCSHLDTACFTFFMDEFQRYLIEKQIKEKVLLIGDGATAHSLRAIPENVQWKKLPTACPELNPVERLFEELRKVLSNRVFASKDEVEDCLTFWMQQYQKQPEAVVKLTNFSWINDAF